MTGDEFTARYRLREQLGQGEVVSFRATDARGAAVFVHVLRGEAVEPFDAAGLDERGRAELREVLEVEGLPVVVTEPIEAFSTFEAWRDARRASAAEAPGAFTRIFRVVEEPGSGVAAPETPPSAAQAPPPSAAQAPPPSAAQAPPPSAAQAPPPSAPQAPPPSAAQAPPPPPSGPPAAPPPAEAAPEPPPAGRGSEPGEFTRRFGALRGPEQPSAPPPPASPGPAPSVTERGGEHAGGEPPTRPVQQPSAPPPSSPRPFEAIRVPDPPTEAEEEATGVFTRIMSARPVTPSSGGSSAGRGGAPSSPARPPDAYRAPPPPPPPDPVTPSPPSPDRPQAGDPHAPGPFTLAMKGYRQPADPPPSLEPSDYQVSDDYLSRLQGGREGPSGGSDRRREAEMPGPQPRAEPVSRPGMPPVPSGPSEYTRVIRGGGFGAGRPPVDPLGARGAPPPAPAPPPPPAQTPRGASKTGIVVAVVLVLAVIAAIVLYVALRPPSG